MNNLIGRTLGGYQILEQLGKGGMAVVYKAYQPSLDRYVAVKVLPAYLTHEPDFEKRFEREARAIAKLEHPHILAVYDTGAEDGLHYIAMRYVEAGTLKEAMGQPLPVGRVARLITQVSRALDYAHDNGVVHRDVKPSNVLLDRDDWVLLTDFGVARMMESTEQLTATGVGMGTPAYMSPEQGRGDRVDHRSDVYSLGVMLFEMLTGKLPYEADTPLAIVMKHLYDPLPMVREHNPRLPEAIERVVLKAMAKDPEDRYQSAGALSEALEEAAREAPPTIETTDRQVTAAKGLLRRFWWLAPAWLAVAAVAFVLSTSVLQDALGRGAETDGAATSVTSAPTTAPTKAPAQEAGPSAEPQASGIYDDFEDPGHNGSFNSERWRLDGPTSCSVVQGDGRLTMTAIDRGGTECVLTPNLPGMNVAEQSASVRARLQMASDRIGEFAEQAIRIHGSDPARGYWVSLCTIQALEDRAVALFEIYTDEGSLYSRLRDIEFDRWFDFQIESEPVGAGETRFICTVDGEVLGSTVHSLPTDLQSVELQVVAWRPTGTEATSFVDEVQFAIEDAVVTKLYDGFEDPAFDGGLNEELWELFQSGSCTVSQQGGQLVAQNTAAEGHTDCSLAVVGLQIMPADQPAAMEALVQISSDHVGGRVEQVIRMVGTAGAQSDLVLTCGLVAHEAGPEVIFLLQGVGQPYAEQHTAAEYDRWYDIQMQVEPTLSEGVRFACYVDGELIGSAAPHELSELRDLVMRFDMLAYRAPAATATSHADDVRLGLGSTR